MGAAISSAKEPVRPLIEDDANPVKIMNLLLSKIFKDQY